MTSRDENDGIGKWREQGVTPKNLVFSCPDFVVFIDDDLEIDWITDDAYDTRMDAIKADPRWATLSSAVTEMQAFGVMQLGRPKCMALRRQVGTAMQLGLGGDLEGAMKALAAARTFLKKTQTETSRIRVIVGSTAVAMAVTAAAAAVALLIQRPSWTEFAVCSAGGAWGSWLSVSLRVDKLQLDPSDGLWLHIFEASRRIAVGAIAGPVVLVAAKIGIAAQGGAKSALLVGFIAGFSERKLPAMFSKLGGDSVTG